MFSFTSTATETELNAALSAGYSGFANISASAKAHYQQIIGGSDIQVISRDGDPAVIQDLLDKGTLATYFRDKHTLDQYSPIGFVLKNCTAIRRR
ncbi:hypothetical protein DY245_27895 [Streptomyces inhibens]|uniref:Uncharacterized protein n=1 Tax=Streptomyces inhibens TaxID=2293571 RepID=A0A371PXM2_STRIH|nr:hypothetical protein [Streptomyces inhibens]REK87217.1 hypothetical protein DY245_27895 [Streptomyces inhibens]